MALPTPFYLLLTGNAVQKIENAESYTDVVITDYYDTETYRNLLPSSVIGQEWRGTFLVGGVNKGPGDYDDRIAPTPPHVLQKSRTERQFVDASGNIVGTAWLDSIISSGSQPTFLR